MNVHEMIQSQLTVNPDCWIWTSYCSF